MAILYGGRIAMVPSGDGHEGKQGPPQFKAPRKLKKKGATEADLSEVDRILDYNRLFSPHINICWFVRTFLAL